MNIFFFFIQYIFINSSKVTFSNHFCEDIHRKSDICNCLFLDSNVNNGEYKASNKHDHSESFCLRLEDVNK